MTDLNPDSSTNENLRTEAEKLDSHEQAGLPAPDAVLDLEFQLGILAAENFKLEGEKQELLRLAQSRQAEFENFRRRVDRERLETVDLAAGDAFKSLLPIVDDFSRAVAVQTTDSSYAKGVELIHQRLGEILTNSGLEPMDCLGQIFDPNLHYAIDKVESAGAEDGLILEEFQKGYRFRGKLLRPAMVKVAARI